MAYLSLVRVAIGEVGVIPGDVKMVSSDNLATITTAGYLNTNGNLFKNVALSSNDVIECFYSYNVMTKVGTLVYLIPSFNNGIITLTAWDNTASEPLTSAHIFVGNASNVATDVAMTGDIAITNAGVTSIGAGVIVNADVSATAAVAYSKLAALTDGNILVGSAANVPTSVAMSGDATIINSGALTVANNAITSAKTSPLMLKYAAVTMSAAQFNGAYVTPHLLVAAGGANTLLVLEGAYVLMTYGTTQFANGGVAHIQYGSTTLGAGIIASSTQAAANFADAASTALYFNPGIVKQPFTTAVNLGLYFSNVTGAFDTGDSTFVVHIWYRTIPTV